MTSRIQLLAYLIKVSIISCLFLIACKKTQNPSSFNDRDVQLSIYNLGGDFSLTDHHNKAFHLKDHRGNVLLIFFGFTYCSDYCPSTLNKLIDVYKILGLKGKLVKMLFVSIDPSHDTPSQLRKYLYKYKGLNAIGLTGKEDELRKVAKQYKVIYPKNHSHSMKHSTYLFLVDQVGKVRYLFRNTDDSRFIASIVQSALPD